MGRGISGPNLKEARGKSISGGVEGERGVGRGDEGGGGGSEVLKEARGKSISGGVEGGRGVGGGEGIRGPKGGPGVKVFLVGWREGGKGG